MSARRRLPRSSPIQNNECRSPMEAAAAFECRHRRRPLAFLHRTGNLRFILHRVGVRLSGSAADVTGVIAVGYAFGPALGKCGRGKIIRRGLAFTNSAGCVEIGLLFHRKIFSSQVGKLPSLAFNLRCPIEQERFAAVMGAIPSHEFRLAADGPTMENACVP
jgi:hypothetical protein